MDDIFSSLEIKVIDAIANKEIPISSVVQACYKGRRDQPLNPSSVISVTIKRINKKCKHHRLSWFINGAGAGRLGRTVWKDTL